jgi:hypothetical protein
VSSVPCLFLADINVVEKFTSLDKTLEEMSVTIGETADEARLYADTKDKPIQNNTDNIASLGGAFLLLFLCLFRPTNPVPIRGKMVQ